MFLSNLTWKNFKYIHFISLDVVIFKVFNERMTQQDARARCAKDAKDAGAPGFLHLPRPTNHRMNDFYFDLYTSKPRTALGSFWIDISEVLPMRTPRQWIFGDGSSALWFNWKSNEPNNHQNKGEHSVQAYSSGLWNDRTGSDPLEFMCIYHKFVDAEGICPWLRNCPSDNETCIKYFKRNKIVYQDITVYKTFDISISLKLAPNNQSSYPNIFGFQQKGVPSWKSETPQRPLGAKVPAVFLKEDTNQLHICMSINDNGNLCWDSDVISSNTWFTLNLRQVRINDEYEFQILIDKNLKHKVINNKPMIFENVNGIISNSYQPERDYPTPFGQYKAFRFISRGRVTITTFLVQIIFIFCS